MPRPWKKPPQSIGGGGVSRLFAGLRVDRGASLVVQTGFPTSLADLIVKNCGRLKKPARRKQQMKKPLPEPAALAPTSGVFSAARSPGAHGSDEARRRGSGVVFGFLLVMTLVMAALTVERKKFVAGTVMSAFSLWLLDWIGLRVGVGNRCLNVKGRSDSVVGGWDLDGRGVVSPIREIGIGSCSESMRSEVSPMESIDSDRASEDMLERKDFVAVVKGNSKVKKLFRKLVPMKYLVAKDTKDGEDLSERGISTSITEVEEEKEEEEAGNVDDDAVLSSGDALLINASHRFTVRSKEDTEVIQENRPGISSRSSYQLVFCTIVLLGLLGGKSAALVLCLSWFLFHRSMKSLWKKDRGFSA